MKFIQATVSALLFASHCLQEVASHAVETRYCINTDGDLRIFVEHWHSLLDDEAKAGTLTVEDLSTSQQTDILPDGMLTTVNWDQIHLPGNCTTGSAGVLVTEQSSTCTGGTRPGGTQGNWVYYDFSVQCYVPVAIRIIRGNTVVLEEGCDELYPVDINTTFTNCGPTSAPTPAPTPTSQVSIPATPSPIVSTASPTPDPNTPGGHDGM